MRTRALHSASLLASMALAAAACAPGPDEMPSSQTEAHHKRDSGVPFDAGGNDSSAAEASSDAPEMEVGGDSSPTDAGHDAGAIDAGADTSVADTSVADTGVDSSPTDASGPTGTMQTITDYGWSGTAVYQPAGSPWWALNNAWGGPPPGTQAIDYYPNNFPNYTTIRWSYGGSGGNVLGYPEVIIGDQNDHTLPSPNGVEPAWHGMTLGSLSHFIVTWDIVINSFSGDNWDILFENHMNGNEVGIFLKDPWVSSGIAFTNLGGISGIGVPNCWAAGSFCIVPSAALAGTPMLSGTIDFMPIWNWAISNGWMSSSYVIDGWEMGIEATNGSGSVTFNSISVTAM